MLERRLYMSKWVIHFVHRRKHENDPVIFDASGDGQTLPLHAEPSKDERYDLWRLKWDEVRPGSDAEPMSVLLQILDDAHVQAGWSMRGGRPTIYGPRPACCFTEMPLHALIEYAKFRANTNVDTYGVALLKDEFFAAGGRPVIYGLSGQHRESGNGVWPRYLDPSCGIAEHEQYRYVAMSLGEGRWIDWSHEREWRWCDVTDQCTCPGLPVWLGDQPISFSRVVVLVKSTDEIQRVIEKLQEMHDSRWHDFDYPFSLPTLRSTRVLAMDDLLRNTDARDAVNLRLDDVPAADLKSLTTIVVEHSVRATATAALAQAVASAAEAAAKWRSEQGRGDVFGFASLLIANPRSELAQALFRAGKVGVIAGVGYRVEGITASCNTGLLGEAEAAVDAAIDVFRAYFPDEVFDRRTRWD